MALTKITSNAFAASAVDSDAVGANTITTAKIADTNVTHAKLHTDMDLSSKTVTLPTISSLTVSGGITLLDGRNSAGLKLDLSGTGHYTIREHTTDDIVKLGGTGSVNFIAHNISSGYVGIGTDAPDRTFHVKSASSAVAKFETSGSSYAGVELKNISGVSNGDTAAYLYAYNASTFLGGLKFVKKDSNSGEIVLRQQINSTNTDVVTISDGNVGIGTTSPISTLDVRGSITTFLDNGGISFNKTSSVSSTNRDYYGAILRVDSNGYHYTSTQGGFGSAANDLAFMHHGNLAFATTSATGDNSTNYPTGRMIILENGNVGIGTRSPSTKLHVVGDGSIADNTAATIGLDLETGNITSGAQYGLKIQQLGSRYNGQVGLFSEILGTNGYYSGDTIEGLGSVRGVGVLGKVPGSSHAYQRNVGVWGISENPAMNYNTAYGVRGEAAVGTSSFSNTNSGDQGAFAGWFQAHGKGKSVGVYADAYLDASPGAGAIAYPLWVASNGSAKMVVKADGNVGIGTTNPNAYIHLGSGNAVGTETNPAIQIGGTTTYRLGLYTESEAGVIDAANGDDGLIIKTKTKGSHTVFRSSGAVWHPEYDNQGDYTSYICSISEFGANGGSTGRYLHIMLQVQAGDMFWLEGIGYHYSPASSRYGRMGGYYYSGGPGIYASTYVSDFKTGYQLGSSRIEVVFDTGGSNSSNRWGSYVFRGGTDTITSSNAIELVQYTWSSGTGQVFPAQ